MPAIYTDNCANDGDDDDDDGDDDGLTRTDILSTPCHQIND